MTLKVATRQIERAIDEILDELPTMQLVKLAADDPADALNQARTILSAFKEGSYYVRDQMLRVAYAAGLEMRRDPVKRAAAAVGYREKKAVPESVDTLRLAIRRLYDVRDTKDSRYSNVCKWANALQASFERNVPAEDLPDVIQSGGGIQGLIEQRSMQKGTVDEDDQQSDASDWHDEPGDWDDEPAVPATRDGKQRVGKKVGGKGRAGGTQSGDKIVADPTDLILAAQGYLEAILTVPQDEDVLLTIRNTGHRDDGLIEFTIVSID